MFIFFFTFCYISTLEETPEVKYYNYKDLGIVSAKKPVDAYRIVEKEDGMIYMIDSVDSDRLYKSDDKGDSWDLVFEEDGWEIEAIFYDYTTKYLWIARNKAGDHPIVHYFDTEDSDNKIDMDQFSSGDAGTYTILALFGSNNKIFAIHYEERAGTETFAISQVDVDPIVEMRNEAQGGAGALVRWTLPIVVASEECWFFAETDAPEQFAYLWQEGLPAFLDVGDLPAGYTLHTGYTRTGIAKVDSGYAETYLILTKTATGAEYLYKFDTVLYDFAEQGLFDLLIQHDYLSQSTLQEKAFHTSLYKIYQFQKNTQQLYLISVVDTDAVIIAITDNFLINDDGDMFEYTDMIYKLTDVEITHKIMDIPRAKAMTKLDDLSFEEGMIMRFYHNYTSGVLPIIYDATYNFWDEEDGTSGTDIDFIDAGLIPANTSIQIISDLGGHKKVLELYDNSAIASFWCYDSFSSQSYGTIEFWMRVTDATMGSRFGFYNGGTIVFYFGIDIDQFRYYDGAWHNVGLVPTDNTWYHIRIDFDCTTGTYQGLAQYDWHVYINGTHYGDYDFGSNQAGLTRFYIDPDTTDSGYYIYVDAVGYSWDTNYDVGDNLFAGGVEEIVFEGFIEKLGQHHFQQIGLISPAKQDLEEKPSGDYSGRSDEILTSLLTDYFGYITKGTFSVGTAMGTITFGGNMTMEVILDELAMFEDWVWYITPTGVLYFTNGTTDSTRNFNEISPIFGINPHKFRSEYNKIKVNGAYIDGVQMVSSWQEDLESQQKIGIKKREIDFGFIDTVALCNTTATNVLNRLGTVPQEVTFNHKDDTVGFIQPGETVTFEYAQPGMTISSDQFIINKIALNKVGVTIYRISSDLL